MVEPIPLYIGLIFIVAAWVQHVFGVAIYIFPFARLTTHLIVTKEKNPDKFKGTIVFQILTGCFFVLLQIFVWYDLGNR